LRTTRPAKQARKMIYLETYFVSESTTDTLTMEQHPLKNVKKIV
jgi:hypothetical protein